MKFERIQIICVHDGEVTAADYSNAIAEQKRSTMSVLAPRLDKPWCVTEWAWIANAGRLPKLGNLEACYGAVPTHENRD